MPTVLVTGATRGIGRAVAEDLSSDHDLLIGGRGADDVERVCHELRSAEPFVADLADEEATERAAASVGRLDGIVHSAGVLGSGSLEQIRRADWRRAFEINVFAVADLTRLLLPQLRRSRGTVVVINSGSGLVAHGPGGIYPASKFAVRAFADCLREEVRSDGIRVTSIHPGRVATDMQQELNTFEGREYDESRYLRPESVAGAVRQALTVPDDAAIETLWVRPAPR